MSRRVILTIRRGERIEVVDSAVLAGNLARIKQRAFTHNSNLKPGEPTGIFPNNNLSMDLIGAGRTALGYFPDDDPDYRP